MKNDVHIKKIGIFGGTGFIGANFIKYLYENLNQIKNNIYKLNEKIISINLDEIRIFFSKTRWNNLIIDIDDKIFNYQKVNIFDENELAEKTKDLDVILNISGYVSFSRKDIESLWKINVIGAKNILEASIKNNCKIFIHTSSISILNLFDTTHYLNENDISDNGFKKRYHSFTSIEILEKFINSYNNNDKRFLKKFKNPYADTKLAGFLICSKIAKNTNIDFINIMPGTVIGKGDINFSMQKLVYNIDKNFIFPRLFGFSLFIDAKDLAKGIFNSIIYGKNGESYILGGDINSNLSYKQIIDKISDTLNKLKNKKRKKLFIDLPKFISIPIAFLAENIFQSKNLTTCLVKNGYIKSKISIEKAKEQLNFIPSTSIDKSIEDLCDEYINYDINEQIKNKKFYFIAKNYIVDPWVNKKAVIFINGEENIYNSKRRVYVVNHPSTFDIHTIINTSIDNFYIPVDYNAFKIPIFGFILKNCGLPPVYPKGNKHIFPMIAKFIKNGYPVFNSIKSGKTTLHEGERVRTGAAVFADLNKADLIPYHIYIEKGRKIISYAPGFDFKMHPYSLYDKAIIYINILPPIKWEDYHQENMTKEDYLKIMEEIDRQFIEKDKEMDKFFEENKEKLSKIKRIGGSRLKLKY